MLGKVLETVWLIRFGVSILATAAVAWSISFWVADYVVKANTSSNNEALNSLQSAISAQSVSNAQTVQSIQSAMDATNAANRQTADALRMSLDTLNETIRANTTATDSLGTEMNDLLALSRSQSGQLDAITGRVERIIFAVEGAGIEINAASLRKLFEPNNEQWQDLKSSFGAVEDTPIFLQITPPSE